MADPQELMRGIALASAGDWSGAHTIAQTDETDPLSCWLHACLHKIEGDISNSRYWYTRAGRRLEDYPDTNAELEAMQLTLEEATRRA